MLVEGRKVATTTGQDIPELKSKLHRTYFHLPNPNQVIKKPGRRRAR